MASSPRVSLLHGFFTEESSKIMTSTTTTSARMSSTTPTSTAAHETVNLLDLASAALSSLIVASDQITSLAYQRDKNQKHESGDSIENGESHHSLGSPNAMNIRLKDDGSFVTNTDLAAQQIIAQSLQKVSKSVRLVGEESEEEMSHHVITGYDARAEEIFRLAKKEIQIRYHKQDDSLQYQSNDGEGQPKLPLAQEHPTKTQLAADGENDKNPLSVQTHRDLPVRPSSPSLVPVSPLKEYNVEVERVSVFIDPLDGTKAYAKGDYEPVSILIAIILDQSPCFGVICKPFGHPGQTSVLNTGCVVIYGGTLLGAAYTAGGGLCHGTALQGNAVRVERPLSRTSMEDSAAELAPATTPLEWGLESDDAQAETTRTRKALPRAVISSSRSQGIVQEFVTHLGSKGMINPTPLMISGAGEKSLRIILRRENEGLWFFPKGGTSLWDVAASDALLRATGGRLTDKNGQDMDYSKSRLEAENEDGVVACFDHSLHAECIKLFLEGTWTDS